MFIVAGQPIVVRGRAAGSRAVPQPIGPISILGGSTQDLSFSTTSSIPGIAFLYIAGTIGWAGRNYLKAIRADKDATMKEIQIDLPIALKCTLDAAKWPLAAFAELTSNKLTENDSKVTVSPR
ncbi:MAG: hypothetical protein EB123_08320 [Synechococcaceae bacterium WBB_32_011]|nr:hypothetical protein [Synechococcaceae bacterium WBB_32_011]